MMSLLLVLALQGSIDARALEFHCDDPQNQMEMNICAGLDFERADAALNILWRQVIASARARDRELDQRYDQRPATEAKLREAQRAWLVFRDAHCTVQGYDEARGRSMEPMVYGACRAELTRQRTAQLRGLGE
jgi:uncharacterized protein YecT (DUF1311 family)